MRADRVSFARLKRWWTRGDHLSLDVQTQPELSVTITQHDPPLPRRLSDWLAGRLKANGMAIILMVLAALLSVLFTNWFGV